MIVYRINGKSVTKDEWDAHKGAGLRGGVPMATVAYKEHDPLISEGIGCMRSQVPEMREAIRKHRIRGVTVCDNGQLKITSRRGRKELLRIRGLHDNDGGYGD